MDPRMSGGDGLTAISRISALPEPPSVVAMTTFDAPTSTRSGPRATGTLVELDWGNRTQAGAGAYHIGLVIR